MAGLGFFLFGLVWFLPLTAQGRRGKEALWGFSYKSTDPIYEGSALPTIHFPVAPPSNSITVRGYMSTYKVSRGEFRS